MKHLTRIALALSACVITQTAIATYGDLLQLAQSLKILSLHAPATTATQKTPTKPITTHQPVKPIDETPLNAPPKPDAGSADDGLTPDELLGQLTKKQLSELTEQQRAQLSKLTKERLIELTNKLLAPARNKDGINVPVSLRDFAAKTTAALNEMNVNQSGHIEGKLDSILNIVQLISKKNVADLNTFDKKSTVTKLIIALLIVHPLDIVDVLNHLRKVQFPEKNQYHIIETIYDYALKCLEEGLARTTVADGERGFCKDFTVATQIPIILKPTILLLEETPTQDAEACLTAISKLRNDFLASPLYQNFGTYAQKCGIQISSKQYIQAITVQKRSYCVVNPTIPNTDGKPTTEEYPYIPIVLDLQTIADAIADYKKLGTPIASNFNGQLALNIARNEIFIRLKTLAQFLRNDQGSQKPCVRCFAMEMGKIFAGDDVGPKYNRIHYHPPFDKQQTIIKHALYGGQQFPIQTSDTSCYIYMENRSKYMEAVDNAVSNAYIIDTFIKKEAKPTTATEFQELQKAVTDIPVTDVIPSGPGVFTYKPLVQPNLSDLVKYLQRKWLSFESNERSRQKIQVK